MTVCPEAVNFHFSWPMSQFMIYVFVFLFLMEGVWKMIRIGKENKIFEYSQNAMDKHKCSLKEYCPHWTWKHMLNMRVYFWKWIHSPKFLFYQLFGGKVIFLTSGRWIALKGNGRGGRRRGPDPFTASGNSLLDYRQSAPTFDVTGQAPD